MRIRIQRGPSSDSLEAHPGMGVAVRFSTPHKGPVPHDAVHLFVERAFGLQRGFWGLVAEGLSPDDIQALATTGGHASAARAGTPDPGIVQLLQAERLVEIFEADLWGGGQGDEADLISLAGTACAQSHVPPPPVPEGAVAQVRADLAAFARTWTALPRGGEVELEWMV
ncbi:MAG: hypothetical protein RL588_1597 [Pseudomonadota bacterium]|jgi:hypothetical protein